MSDKQKMMAELVMTYVNPILLFSDMYIDKNGYIGPIGGGNRDKLIYHDEKEGIDKQLVLPKNDYEFSYIKEHNDEYIYFNPLRNPKHMLNVVMYMLKRKLVFLYEDEYNELVLGRKDDLDSLDFDDDVDEELENNSDIISIIQMARHSDDIQIGFEIHIVKFPETKFEETISVGFHENLVFAMWQAAFLIVTRFTMGNDNPELAMIETNNKLTKIISTINKISKMKNNVYENKEEDTLSVPDVGDFDETNTMTIETDEKKRRSLKIPDKVIKLKEISDNEFHNLQEDDDYEII